MAKQGAQGLFFFQTADLQTGLGRPEAKCRANGKVGFFFMERPAIFTPRFKPATCGSTLPSAGQTTPDTAGLVSARLGRIGVNGKHWFNARQKRFHHLDWQAQGRLMSQDRGLVDQMGL